MKKKYGWLIGGALLWILLQILSLSFTDPSNFLLYDHFMIPELDLKGSTWQTGKYVIVKEGNFLKCINCRWSGNSRGWVFINGQEAKYVDLSKLAETKEPSYSLSNEGEIILPLSSEGKKIDVHLERTFIKFLCSPYTALFYFLLIWFFTGKIFLRKESDDKWFCPTCLLIFSVGFLLSFSGEIYFYPDSIGYLNYVCSGWLKTIETNAGTCRTPGYPLFLLALLKISPASLSVLPFMQYAIFLSCLAWLMMEFVKIRMPVPIAITIFVLMGDYVDFFHSSVMTESLALSLLIGTGAASLWLFRLSKSSNWPKILMGCVILSLLCMMQIAVKPLFPVLFFAPTVLVAGLFFSQKHWKKTIVCVLVVMGLEVLPILGYCSYRWVKFDSFNVISLQAYCETAINIVLLDREKIEQLSPETKGVVNKLLAQQKDVKKFPWPIEFAKSPPNSIFSICYGVLAWSPTDLSRAVIVPMYFDLPRPQRMLIPFEVYRDNVCKPWQKDLAKVVPLSRRWAFSASYFHILKQLVHDPNGVAEKKFGKVNLERFYTHPLMSMPFRSWRNSLFSLGLPLLIIAFLGILNRKIHFFAKDFDLFPKELAMGIICCGLLFPLGLMLFLCVFTPIIELRREYVVLFFVFLGELSLLFSLWYYAAGGLFGLADYFWKVRNKKGEVTNAR